MKIHYIVYTLRMLGIVCLAMPACLVCAQEDVEMPMVNVDFKAVSLGRGIADFGYIEDGKKEPFYAPSYSLSVERKYRGPQLLRFVQTQKADSGKQEVPVASIMLPLEQKKVLILFAPSPKDPEKFLTKALPYMDENFPADRIRVYNYTGRELTVGLGGAVQKLEKWRNVTVPLRLEGVELFIPRLNKPVGDEPDLCREVYSAPEGSRITLIIMRAPSARNSEDEALSVVPLVDAPIEPVPGADLDAFWKQAIPED